MQDAGLALAQSRGMFAFLVAADDPVDRRVYVYRPGIMMECLENPTTISGDPELTGFVLDLAKIWDATV